MSNRPISSVVVIGGGIVGWSAAAVLKRRLPRLEVSVLPLDPPADALADRVASTLPSIVEFHSDLGLTEADTVVRAKSGYRLGTRFEAWADDLPDYVHAYGLHGRPIGPGAFHQHWLRAAKEGQAPAFESASPAAVMAALGRFAHPETEQESPLANVGYGLRLDVGRYREMMRAFARHLGAVETPGELRDVRLRPGDGFVDALLLDDGSELSADLFVDASGPRALVRSRLDQDWEDWSRWLPADRILFAQSEASVEPSALDAATATPAGWQWRVSMAGGASHGLVYSSAHMEKAEAQRLLQDAAQTKSGEPAIKIGAGCRPQPWLRNCVAIGDSAVVVEPLEWTNLHLAHSAIDRVAAMMPDADCSAVELWDYNRQAHAEAQRVRDFLALHYTTASRSGEPFWAELAEQPLPPSLEHTLLQFRERGRLPFYEEETFARDSWLTVLLGQGVIPRRIDPIVSLVPPQQSKQAIVQIENEVTRLVQQLPGYPDYLRNFYRQAAR